MKTTITSGKSIYVPPLLDHRPGDIWTNLPTNGLLKHQYCGGIVITPACDLANRKVETLTYLPIVPIEAWLSMRGFYREMRGILISLGKQIGIELDVIFGRNSLPKPSDVSYAIELAEEKMIQNKPVALRISAACELLNQIIDAKTNHVDMEKLRVAMGDKAYERATRQLVTNSYSNDLHFLPKDEEDSEWTAIPTHSLVLFRYPQTAPIEIFDLANDVNAIDWAVAVDNLARELPSVPPFRDKKPLKVLRLRNEFMSDLLTRFVALFVRLGSPDFSEFAIENFLLDIRK